MNDAEYWEDRLDGYFSKIKSITGAQKLNKNDTRGHHNFKAEDNFEELEKYLNEAKKCFKALKMEYRLIQNTCNKKCLKNRIQNIETELCTIESDVLEARMSRNNNTNKLFQGEQRQQKQIIMIPYKGDDTSNNKNNKVPASIVAGDLLIEEIHAMQESTTGSLLYTQNLIQETKTLGLSTLEELENQREIIQNINSNADRMDKSLDTSETLLKRLGRHMATFKRKGW